MARRGIPVLLLSLGLIALPALSTDDLADAEEKLAKARETHAATFAKVREALIRQVDARIEAEEKRKDPDLTKIEALQSERAAVENGEAAKSTRLDVKSRKQLVDANKKLVTALRGTRAEYIRAKEYEKAKAIEAEIEEIANPTSVNARPNQTGVVPVFVDGELKIAWRHRQHSGDGAVNWRVEDKMLVATGAGDKMFTLPLSDENFVMRAEVWRDDAAKALFLFRCAPRDGRPRGYSVGLGGGPALANSGAIYIWSWMSSNVRVLNSLQLDNPPADRWFPVEVQVVGNTFRARVNGSPVVLAQDDFNTFPNGEIGFSSMGGTVKIRKIEYKKLGP